MVGFSRPRSSTRPTQTTSTAPLGRLHTERLLRDLAFVLHLTDKVKRQITAEEPEPELALAGVGDDGV